MPRLQERAKRELDQAFSNIQGFAKGRIILGSYESMSYQAAMVRSAKETIFAIHTVKDERDLSKWTKREGEFNILLQAYIDVRPRLKPGAMVRVFVVANELTGRKELMASLRNIKEMSENKFGFKSSIVLRTMAVLEAQAYLSLLQVDRSGLVVVQIESGREEVRDYKIVAYEGKGLEGMLSKNDFSDWTALQRVPDMSSECFAILETI